MQPTLLILAAGMGSRYGGLKQVDPLGRNGEAIIEYSIFDAIRAGFGKVVFVIREGIEDTFRAKFSNKFDHKIEVAYVFQEVDTPIAGITDLPAREKPWGTAHAVLVAKAAIREPFAVINADDYYGVQGYQIMADFLRKYCSPTHYAMMGYTLKNTLSEAGHVNRGICEIDQNNFLTSVVERIGIHRRDDKPGFVNEQGDWQELDENVFVSMNFWGFHPSFFEAAEQQFIEFVNTNRENPKAEFYIPTVVNKLLEHKDIQLTVLRSDDQWYGITYREDKPIVEQAFSQLMEEGVYPESLW